PDGNSIAFASAPEIPPTGLPPGVDPADLAKHPPSYDFRNMEFYVMASDCSARRRITQDAGIGFSPDGFAGPQWGPATSTPAVSETSTALVANYRFSHVTVSACYQRNVTSPLDPSKATVRYRYGWNGPE